VEWLRAEDRQLDSMSGFQPIDQAGAGTGQLQDIRLQSGAWNVLASCVRSMPDVDSTDHSSATVLISTLRTASIHRSAALHGIAPTVGGLRHMVIPLIV